jgi:hypothetical protein
MPYFLACSMSGYTQRLGTSMKGLSDRLKFARSAQARRCVLPLQRQYEECFVVFLLAKVRRIKRDAHLVASTKPLIRGARFSSLVAGDYSFFARSAPCIR